MVDGTAAISWGTVLTDVLNAPVPELAVSDDVDAAKDLLYTWALYDVSIATNKHVKDLNIPYPPPSSSRRCSERLSYQSHQERPRATSHEEPR